MFSRPLHPALVHFPIALFMTGYGLDVLHPILLRLPAFVQELAPPTAELSRLSYYALSAGLITAIPSTITGILAAKNIMDKVGSMYLEDNKTLKPKVKVLFLHAAINDLVILGSAGYWWMRRQAGGPAYDPEPWMVILGAVFSGVLVYAAALGGTLVYNYGAGMSIGKTKKHD